MQRWTYVLVGKALRRIEGADRDETLQRLVEVLEDRAPCRGVEALHLARAEAVGLLHLVVARQQRHEPEREERQHPDDHAEAAHQRERAREDADAVLRQRTVDVVEVRREPIHDAANGRDVEELDRGFDQPREHVEVELAGGGQPDELRDEDLGGGEGDDEQA